MRFPSRPGGTPEVSETGRPFMKGAVVALRLQELHPIIVHAPLALLPLAVGAEILGALTDQQVFRTFGRRAITLAAAGAVGAAVTGLIAGEEVNVEGETREMLQTHRNLNAVATIVAITMAVWRHQVKKPDAAYLAMGIAGIGVVTYTGYLGGELVYQHGVGVDPAKGVWRPDAPQLKRRQFGAFVRDAAVDVWHGLKHMGEELAQGKIVPALVKRRPHEAKAIAEAA
jgi:uncharacterized membrane protein